MTRIGRLFERLKDEGRPALIGYLTAGDPDPNATPGLVAALERGGCDLIELGVPFSDPIADGPVIQRASERALRAGTSLDRVLAIAAEIRKTSQIPLLLFSYMNPLLRHGLDTVAARLVENGIDGCLLTDLSVEEAEPYVKAMRGAGLDSVFMGAPTSTAERLRLVARYSSGFIYLVSRTGVTGERSSVSDAVGPLVEAMRRVTELPIAVGFGISTAEQVRAVGRIADGVVVGSAIVRAIEQGGRNGGLEAKLEQLAAQLAGGLPSRTA